MAAQAWKIYARAKERLGDAALNLGSGVFRMALYRNSASGTITSLSTISVFGSVAGEISATGGYAAGGKSVPNVDWTVGTSTLQMKWTYTATGVIFTASGASLNNIRYALIYKCVSAGSKPTVCFASLSSAAFTISSGNTLTVLPAATGVFTLA